MVRPRGKVKRWKGLNPSAKYVIFYRKANGKRWYDSGQTYKRKSDAYKDIKKKPSGYFYMIRELE